MLSIPASGLSKFSFNSPPIINNSKFPDQHLFLYPFYYLITPPLLQSINPNLDICVHISSESSLRSNSGVISKCKLTAENFTLKRSIIRSYIS